MERLLKFINYTDEQLENILVPIEEFDGTAGFTVADYTKSPLSVFHPKATRMVLRDDDYYLSNRANHFVLIFGMSEALENYEDCVVCLADHKGGLCITVHRFTE